jgi:hypothetical protein
MWLKMDKVKENQSARNLQGKVGVEILIDRAQLTRMKKWEIKAVKRGTRKQRPRIKYPESPLRKMLKYWDDSLHTKGKKIQRMVKYCCFIWTQEPILKPLVFCPKFGSDKDWVCQLLIEHVNDKSSVT